MGAITGQKSYQSSQTLPYPEQGRQIASSIADAYSNMLGSYNNNPTSGGGSDFQAYFENIGGPPSNFTDIPVGGVYSPQQMTEGVNAIYANNDARAANQSRNISQQLAPGYGSNSPLLAQLQQSNQGRFQAMGQDQARQFSQKAAQMNAQQRLASAQAQTNVESLRAGDDQNSRSLGLQGRGQDLDFNRALLGLLAGGGSLFSPLTNVKSEEVTGTPTSFGRPTRSGYVAGFSGLEGIRPS